MDLSTLTYNEGLEIGYSRVGALSLDDLDSFQEIKDLKIKYPQGKALIIGVWHYNFYKIPERLKEIASKRKLFEGRYLEGSDENNTAKDFEEFFKEQNLKVVDVFHLSKDIKYKIGQQMEIGLVRKNGFFYTEEGSYCRLHAWLVDENITWQAKEAPDPCPGHCSICIRTCPQQALDKGYSKDHNKCIDSLSQDPIEGCDICQDNCPYNKHRWAYEEEFITLDY